MDDEEMGRRFDAMMRRLNDNHEAVLTELRGIRGDLRDLRTEHSVTRDTVLQLPGTVLGVLEKPLLARIRASEDRLDKLEGKQP